MKNFYPNGEVDKDRLIFRSIENKLNFKETEEFCKKHSMRLFLFKDEKSLVTSDLSFLIDLLFLLF